MRPGKYFKQLAEPVFNAGRTREIFIYNPAAPAVREDAKNSKFCVYTYNAVFVERHEVTNIRETFAFTNNDKISWINIEGICKADIEAASQYFRIHPLLVEDILSIGQRPKMDDIEGILFCLLNMLYFNEKNCSVEQEQISIVLGKNFVITFQEDAERDVFKSIRNKLNIANSKLRVRGADYLYYSFN